EFDAKDIVYVRIDRRRKLPVTTFLYALGLTAEEILDHFYDKILFVREAAGWRMPFDADRWRGAKPSYDLVNAENGEVVVEAGKKITPRVAKKLATDGLKEILLPVEEIYGRYAAEDVIDLNTGKIFIEAGDELTPDHLLE